MSAVVDALLAEFEGKYARLVWADKNIILDLTAFCERNIAISLHLSDIIIARIIDPATDVTHKLPIFYLIDAVMKHVGGPYPALFSRHLAEVFKRAFDELPIKEKERLDYLLVTWEERGMLGADLLVKMRGVVAAKKAVLVAAEMIHTTAEARIREAQRIAAILASTPTLQQQQVQRRQQEMQQQQQQQQQHQQRRQQEDEQRQQQLQHQQQQMQTPRYDNNNSSHNADDRGVNSRRQGQGQNEPHHYQQQNNQQGNQQGRNQQQGNSQSNSQQSNRRFESDQPPSRQQQGQQQKRPRDDGPFDRDRDRDRDRLQQGGRDRDRDRDRDRHDDQTPYRNNNNNNSSSMNNGNRGNDRRGSKERSNDRSLDRSLDRGNNRGTDRGNDRNNDRVPDRNDRGPGSGSGSGSGPVQSSYSRAVDAEMASLLRQMYADMDVKETIPLDKLQVANPDLFAQMRAAAEAAVKSSGQGQGHSQGQGLGGGQGGGSGSQGGGGSGGRDSNGAPLSDGMSERRKTLRSATGLGVGIYPTETNNVSNSINNEGEKDKSKLTVSGVSAPVCGPFVNAFIAEAPVVLDIGRAEALLKQLLDTESKASLLTDAETLFNVLDEKFRVGLMAATHHVAERLKLLLGNYSIPPKLPAILFGPLPLEPSKQFLLANADSIAAAAKPVQRKQKPKFRADELDKRLSLDKFNAAINNLYKNQKYQYVEDGVRFKTLVELVKHTDACLTKKEMTRKQEQSNERTCRQWYSTVNQWVTDFSALVGGVNKNQNQGPESGDGNVNTVTEEYVVPADEHFTRCPVSKEVFETVWDEDEGEFMYRNAVKVLVTELADPELYKLSMSTEQDGVQYIIVHKLLVLDGWLQSGRAETLKGATLRYEAMGRGNDKVTALLLAAGEDEDEDDVFVMLELLT